MRFGPDERGQSVQVGAVLLFGILIIGLAVWQATVIPEANREVEFEAYLDASEDLVGLRDGVITAGTRGTLTTTTVRTGVRYPTRLLFVNPPPSSGSLSLEPRDGPPPTVAVDGARAVSGEPANVRRYWNGSRHTYPTRAATFRPSYSQVDSAQPVVVAGSGVYRTTDAGPVPITGQTFVDGDRITVVTLDGSLSSGGVTTTVVAAPTSASTRSVTVTGAGGDDFNVTLPTYGSASAWNDTAVAADIRRNPNVRRVTALPGQRAANVTLDGDRTYVLRFAHVSLRTGTVAPTAESPSPRYVLAPERRNVSTTANGSVDLVLEVRDRYDNPVSGANVTFRAPSGAFAGSESGVVNLTTNDRGRATSTFDPDATGTVAVAAGLNEDGDADLSDETALNRTSFGVSVVDTGDDGSPNPAGPGSVLLQDVSGSGDVVTLTFDNTANETRTFDEARIAFYYPDQGNQGPPDYGDLEGNSQDRLEVGDDFEPIDTTVELAANTAGQTVTVEFSQDGVAGDFFILAVRYEETGGTSRYFVAVPGTGGGGNGGNDPGQGGGP